MRGVRLALQVHRRYGQVHGNYLAGAISMAAFLAIFPLLLVALAVAGFVSHAHGDIAPGVISHLGLNGQAAREITNALHTAERSRRAASAIGLVGLLWSGLGVVGAMQYAYDQVWRVHERGLEDKLYGLAWLAGAVFVFAASAAVTALLAFLPEFLSPIALLVALATNVALWWWTAKILLNRDVGWRPLLPGAVLGGVGLEVLKAVGGFYVPRLVSQSSQLYGSIGIVFAILAWLLLLGQLVVYSATLNVVLWERGHGTVAPLVESTRSGRPEEAHGRAVA